MAMLKKCGSDGSEYISTGYGPGEASATAGERRPRDEDKLTNLGGTGS
jgi:hypothetical protein